MSLRRRFSTALVFAGSMVWPGMKTVAAQAPLQVARIQIVVLNAGKGKPVQRAKATTTVVPLETYATPIPSATEQSGKFSLLVQTGTAVRTTVGQYAACSNVTKADRKKPPIAYSVDDILSHGIVAENRCNKRTASVTPGELILFVHSTHWWKRLRY